MLSYILNMIMPSALLAARNRSKNDWVKLLPFVLVIAFSILSGLFKWLKDQQQKRGGTYKPPQSTSRQDTNHQRGDTQGGIDIKKRNLPIYARKTIDAKQREHRGVEAARQRAERIETNRRQAAQRPDSRAGQPDVSSMHRQSHVHQSVSYGKNRPVQQHTVRTTPATHTTTATTATTAVTNAMKKRLETAKSRRLDAGLQKQKGKITHQLNEKITSQAKKHAMVTVRRDQVEKLVARVKQLEKMQQASSNQSGQSGHIGGVASATGAAVSAESIRNALTTKNGLISAVVYSEIIGLPLSLRPHETLPGALRQ